MHIIYPDFQTKDSIPFNDEPMGIALPHRYLFINKNRFYVVSHPDINLVYKYDDTQKMLIRETYYAPFYFQYPAIPGDNIMFEIDSIPYIIDLLRNYRRGAFDVENKTLIVDTSALYGVLSGMIRHCNGRDWIILTGTNKEYLIDLYGYDTVKIRNRLINFVFDGKNLLPNLVNYDVFDIHPLTHFLSGFSEDGKKMVIYSVNYGKKFLIIGDLNRKTGELTNIKNLTDILPNIPDTFGVVVLYVPIIWDSEHLLIEKIEGYPDTAYYYKLNITQGILEDTIAIPIKSFALDDYIIQKYNIPDSSIVYFRSASSFAVLNHNNFFQTKKRTYNVILKYAVGEEFFYINQIFIVDFSNYPNIRFKRIYDAGALNNENITRAELDSISFNYIENYPFSYLPTELEAGFEYSLKRDCMGNSYEVVFKDTSCCHFYRIWDFGDGSVSDTLWVTQHAELYGKIDSFQVVSHEYSRPGRYKVKLKILNPYNYGAHLPVGEFVMDSVEQWIEIPEVYPDCIYPSASHASEVCYFDTLVVRYTGTENYDTLYYESVPLVVRGGFVGDSTVIRFPAVGDYVLRYTAANATYDTTWESSVRVLDCDELWIPNAFSPNRDGVNDVFSYECRSCVWHRLEIYNRDSQAIYECEGGVPCVWNGVTARGAASEGVYGYRLRVRKLSGAEVERVGTVLLMR